MIKHKIHQSTLKSGAKLVYIKTPGNPISIISAWYKTGSRLDPKGKEGLAHFFEHILISGGTKKYPDSKEKLKLIEYLGINANAFTSKETTVYYHSQPLEKSYESLSILLETLNNNVFSEEDIKREKSVILDEIERSYDNHQNYVHTLGASGVWPKNRMGQSVLGTKESILAFKKEDIENLNRNQYTSDNTTFVVVGDLDTKKIKQVIEKEYNVPSAQTPVKYEKYLRPLPIVVEKRKNNNIAISIGFLAPAITDQESEERLNLLAHYLIGGWIGKLMYELRTKNGLTYGIGGGFVPFSDTGVINFSFTVSKKNLAKALNIFFTTINEVKNDSADANFEGVKNSYISNLLHGTINPGSLINWYGWSATLGGEIFTPEEYKDRINKLTFADIQQVARKYLVTKNRSIAAIGNIKEEDIRRCLQQ